MKEKLLKKKTALQNDIDYYNDKIEKLEYKLDVIEELLEECEDEATPADPVTPAETNGLL